MKKEKSKVGQSSRTPYKHWLYRFMLGKMVGAAATGKTPCGDTIRVLDMCAGDGAETGPDPFSSSPAIADRHTTSIFPGSNRLKRIAYLYERETTTHARLLSRYGGRPHIQIFHHDSKGITLADIGARPGDGVFVYADPNSVSTLPVTPELIRSFTPTTLFLMTLGCNVGGVKRLPIEDRKGWLDVVNLTLRARNRYHDIMIMALNKDDSQWAYLAAFPMKWAEDFQADSVKAGGRHWPNGVSAFSVTRQPVAFREKIQELFFTAKEREQMNQPELTV
jgi:hypothetical protein